MSIYFVFFCFVRPLHWFVWAWGYFGCLMGEYFYALERAAIINSQGESAEMTLQGEPMIMSVQYKTSRNQAVIRNRAVFSMLKSRFLTFQNIGTPVVLKVVFYVTPFSGKKIPKKALREENMRAVHAWELCDYLLSFMQILLRCLIRKYTQIVHIEAEKFYSDNPRTVFTFMSAKNYDYFQDLDTFYPDPETERKVQCRHKKGLQPEQSRNEEMEGLGS